MKKIIVSFSLVLFFAFSPHFVLAEQVTTEEAYRTVLLELVAALKQQITLLQQQLEILQTEEDYKSFISGVEVVADYPVSNLDETNTITNNNHRKYFERVAEVVPDKYHDYFNELTVFVEDDWYTDAYVETLPSQDGKWRYAVNEELLLSDISSSQNTELIVHEFGHVVSYEQIVGVPQPAETECSEYFKHSGCPLQSSFLGQFVNNFWTDVDLDRAIDFSNSNSGVEEAHDYYELHQTDFVSDYAALNPEEDFSETFAQFVLQNQNLGNKYKDKKIQFFYQYPELLAMRKEIRENQ